MGIVSFLGVANWRGVDGRPSHIVDRIRNRQTLGHRIDFSLQIVSRKRAVDKARRIDQPIFVLLALGDLGSINFFESLRRSSDRNHDPIDDRSNRMAKGDFGKTRRC